MRRNFGTSCRWIQFRLTHLALHGTGIPATRAFEIEKQILFMKYEFHPATKRLPLMSPPELDDLSHDLKQNGQKLPIILLDGKIIDGRNRFLACEKAGVEPRVM